MSKGMEKGKQDSSSPVGILEDFLWTEETDTNSSSSKDGVSESESERNSKLKSRWHGFVEMIRSKSRRKISTMAPAPPLSMLKLSRWSRSMRERSRNTGDYYFASSNGLQNCSSSSTSFTFAQLQAATMNFSPENLIGKGGYAEVYKGRLQDGRVVAIKRLVKGTTEEKIADLLGELGMMAHVNHPNTTKLIGYGAEGGMHLVLEYSQLGSLASQLHGSKGKIRWHVRYKVAVGTAAGLAYLHEGCQRRIIHRDIKAANILLKANFEPQICDFGLAKWLPEKWTHHTVSKFEGTFGYLAPEYLIHGIVDEKTDVFAFGVVLLELISRRRALDYTKSQQSLVLWAKPLLKKGHVKDLIDPDLINDYDPRQMNLMLLAASLCVQRSSIRRPTMNQVLQLLKGNLSSLDWKKTRKPSFWKPSYEEIVNDDSPMFNPGIL